MTKAELLKSNTKLTKALQKIVNSTCAEETQTHTYDLDIANKALYQFGQIARKALKIPSKKRKAGF